MNINNWKKLYALASEIKLLKPWEWMSEHDIFGVYDPHSDITGYISVMGMLGEHYAVTAYRGPQAVIDLDKLADGPQPMSPDLFLEIPQLMLSFENPEQLDKKDRDLIKKLGLNFRGKNAWPFFRSTRPGFFPYFLDDDEQEAMVVYLEQAVHVLKRAEIDQDILFPTDDEFEEKFLVRRPGDGEANTWEDHVEEILGGPLKKLEIVFDKELFTNYRQRPAGILTFEMDFFLLNSPVIEENSPPCFPYILMLIEQSSEMIIGFEMLTPRLGFHQMLEEVPIKLLALLSGQPSKPKEIHIQSERLVSIFGEILSNWGIKMELKPELKILNLAREHMEGSMR